MDQAIKRIVLRLFPELKNGYHKPMLGRVERAGKPPKTGGVCSHDEPLYAVDIQPLDAHFRPKGELLRDLVVAVPYAGQHRGFMALPDPGCVVEFCFSYALPHLVHIRGVIPWGLELPPVDAGEAIWQHSQPVHQGYDKDGNWHRSTDQNITDACGKIRECQAGVKQLLKSPKTWVGSDSENLLRILQDFMQTTSEALGVIASHTHAQGPAPDQTGQIAGFGTTVASQKADRLDPITE